MAVSDLETAELTRAIVFGRLRLLLAQRFLLEGEKSARLGGRAMDILIALVDLAGELVGKTELATKVWPDTFVVEGNLKVNGRLAPCSGRRPGPPALHRGDDWTGLPLRRADRGAVGGHEDPCVNRPFAT